ncbi:amidase [Coprinopsis cinerea okayama7|uniref:Amidase n=1 Tax=Coprinopsis cinerea (strain Okayama-7 / 130 / ATCC MYA-4618 / FGSC 9003) TaxID=240176 RepID=A8P994_COPC7|nr:amidase [Coprinopsis cinerea okayama7\|eukprot:XP_001839728.2 amidase [Coprinopsis cinerea okayama7\
MQIASWKCQPYTLQTCSSRFHRLLISVHGTLSPSEVMMAYGKKALAAQKATNCLSDIMFQEASSTPALSSWGPGVDSADVNSSSSTVNEVPRDRLLLGVPVNTVDIEGRDSTIGYSRYVGRPATTSAPLVRLLQDAGALIHAKTTVPTGLFHIETVSDVYGRTLNPHNTAITVGGSSGGGAALVACGGSKIEIGSDIGGSVRIPAHFCGVWSLKGSAGRFPTWGSRSSLAGLEGIQLITAPLASNLDDLEEFWKRVIHCEPWQYDHTCIPLPWRPIDLQQEGRKLKWGVMWDDGTVPPTPACRRALATVANALRKQGHEVVDFTPPDLVSGLQTGYRLLFADGAQQVEAPLQPGERVTGPAQAILNLFNLPRIVKKIFAYFLKSSDPFAAEVYKSMHPLTVLEDRAAIVSRDEYRAQWHKKWIDEGLDFLITVPHPLPAFPHGGGVKVSLMSVGVTFLFNLASTLQLDYSAGVLPVTHVDKDIDGLAPNFTSTPEYQSMNSVVKGVYSVYDAEKMHGLPLGVQVVGRRLEEEKVLQGMRVVEVALKEAGVYF